MGTRDRDDDQIRREEARYDAKWSAQQQQTRGDIARGLSHNAAALRAYYGYAADVPVYPPGYVAEVREELRRKARRLVEWYCSWPKVKLAFEKSLDANEVQARLSAIDVTDLDADQALSEVLALVSSAERNSATAWAASPEDVAALAAYRQALEDCRRRMEALLVEHEHYRKVCDA